MMMLLLTLAACGDGYEDPDAELERGTVDDPAEVEGELVEAEAPATEIIPEPKTVEAPTDEPQPEDITDIVAIDPSLVDVDPVLLATLNEAIDQAAVRTAEEITTRGPLGGGVAGMSAPQIKAIISLIFDVVISGIGFLLLRWLSQRRRDLQADRAESSRQSAERQRDREELARLRSQARQHKRELDVARAERLKLERQHQADKVTPPPEAAKPRRVAARSSFEQVGDDLIHGTA
jgi:hypothetical protein